MSQVQQVKEATDIVQVIGERVSLQRSGANWRGLCPFHSEKSPSFFVNDQFQRYRCFGCAETGDVFTFLEKYEGMSFGEALQYLADRAGITLEKFQADPQEDRRQELLAALDLARQYYHYVLIKHASGKVARQYLKERGISQESIKLFQIGWAPDQWDGFIKYAHGKKKLSLEVLRATGLVVTGRGNRDYDRFRGRIVFPLANHRGQIVGFSGRVIGTSQDDKDQPKYINTPETILYHKAKMLYGYSELYQYLRKERQAIVVEGEFDVISSAQVHVNQVVGIKGSALTLDHLRLLKRVVDKVVLSLDADAAGVKATQRAIQLAQAEAVEVRVLVVPGGKDPDELAQSDPQAWRAAAETSISAYEFLIQAAVKQHDPATPEGRRAIIDALAKPLMGITHQVESDVYIKKLAQTLGVAERMVLADLTRFGSDQTPGQRTQRSEDVTDQATASSNTTRANRLQAYALWLLWNLPADKVALTLQELTTLSGVLPVTTHLQRLAADNPRQPLAELTKRLPSDLQADLFALYAEAEITKTDSALHFAEELKKTLTLLSQESRQANIKAIHDQLRSLDEVSELTVEQQHRQQELLQELTRLQAQVKPAE